MVSQEPVVGAWRKIRRAIDCKIQSVLGVVVPYRTSAPIIVMYFTPKLPLRLLANHAKVPLAVPSYLM
jgi:hypothetical protein